MYRVTWSETKGEVPPLPTPTTTTYTPPTLPVRTVRAIVVESKEEMTTLIKRLYEEDKYDLVSVDEV